MAKIDKESKKEEKSKGEEVEQVVIPGKKMTKFMKKEHKISTSTGYMKR